MPDILLPIQPKFVERIRWGIKTIEIRKGNPWGFWPKHWSGRIFIYASAPVSGVVGYFDCPQTERFTLADIIDLYGSAEDRKNKPIEILPAIGVSLHELYMYACTRSPNTRFRLLHIGPVNWFPEPVPLPYRGITRAPQNFAYLK